MGIEVLIIGVIILGILGAGVYLYFAEIYLYIKENLIAKQYSSRLEEQEEQLFFNDGDEESSEQESTTQKLETPRKSETTGFGGESPSIQAPVKKERPAKPKPMMSPPAPAPPEPIEDSSGDKLLAGGQLDFFGGMDIADKEIDDDNKFATGEILPVTEEPEPAIEDILMTESDDRQDRKKAKKESPEEIVNWMDDLKEQLEEAEEEMPSLEGSDMDDTPDTSYPEKKIASATTAHFSAFYPKEVQTEQRYGVYIYAHAESMLAKITDDAQKFKEELGGNVSQPRIAKASKSLVHGTKITVLLESEELEFEPDILTKKWHGDWTRYEFEFRPNPDLINETAFVRASIMVMGFEIAKIKFAIDIIEPQMQAMSMMIEDELPTNPFVRAKMQSTTTSGYDKIFISYSRKDKMIAEAFKIIQEAAGNDVFFDVDDIRTGEDWQAAIARAIDEADYLQLFWSEHSANSEWCGYEWEYTLKYRCKENKCREFIRPVWWNAPMPPPPESLGHLNFRRMDVEKLMQVDKE